MRVEMRVYRQFDLDLYAFAAAGYSLSQMLEATVPAFANGKPVYILIDENISYVAGGKSAYIHFCFNVDNKDTATVNLLKSVAPRMRTSFCKMILRNSLGQQNLHCFFPGYPEVDALLAIDANKRLLLSRPDTVPISRFHGQITMKSISRSKAQQTPQTQYQQILSSVSPSAPQQPVQQNYQAPPQQTVMPQTPAPQIQPQQYARPQQYAQPQQVQQTYQQYTQAPPVQNYQQVQQQMAAPQPEMVSQPVQTITPQSEPQQTYQQPPVTPAPSPAPPQQTAVSQQPETALIIHEDPEENYNKAPGAVDDTLMSMFDNL